MPRARLSVVEPRVVAMNDALPEYLPFNRKERYFTGTVLPGIIAADDFSMLDRFLSMCGLQGSLGSTADERLDEVQFLTEYGFAESASHSPEWSGYDGGRDTPDVVIAGPDRIIAVEAKLYARQGRTAITGQLQAQQKLVDHWAGVLKVDSARARLVALLPESYANELGDLGFDVVTWEAVLDGYADDAPKYWTRVLRAALDRYERLKSPELAFGTNAQGRLSGAEIVAGYKAGSLEFGWVGRSQGPLGAAWASDVENGSWRSRMYEVRVDPIDAPNWWDINEFVSTVAGDTEVDG